MRPMSRSPAPTADGERTGMKKSKPRLSRQFRTTQDDQMQTMLLIQITRLYEAVMFLAEVQTLGDYERMRQFQMLEEDHKNGRYKTPPPTIEL